jgi:ribosomal protein S12 methylthiotransferase accessory factor YcaO
MPVADNHRLGYKLQRITTEASTGYFACVPENNPDFAQALAHCRTCPHDVFMRRYLHRLLGMWDAEALAAAIAAAAGDLFLLALFFEACLLHEPFKVLRPLFQAADAESLASQTPLVFIKAHQRSDAAAHMAWNRLFHANINEHLPLPVAKPPPLVFRQPLYCQTHPVVSLAQIFQRIGAAGPTPRRFTAAQTHARAIQRLTGAGIALGTEMRHQASLSPIALLRDWNLRIRVHCGRNRFELHGIQTAYGRGLDLEAARAAYAMEIVERCSAFAAVEPDRLVGYRRDHAMIHRQASQLAAEKSSFLDPNTLIPDAPYRDEPLYWLPAVQAGGGENRFIWIPAQIALLFANLDEIQLFSAPGSTGLAAGNTMEEAKVSALLEVIERDSASVMPFTPALCFEVETADRSLAALLDSYRASGIDIRFQDITTGLGVPCCKCFVVNGQKRIISGTGAHLDARRALVAALTETPYPYPAGPESKPGLAGCLRVPLERLPDYSTGSAATDLWMLETLLLENGLTPLYVDLTRIDVGIPVVRAVVPGLDVFADFDRFARVHPRRLAHFRQNQ